MSAEPSSLCLGRGDAVWLVAALVHRRVVEVCFIRLKATPVAQPLGFAGGSAGVLSDARAYTRCPIYPRRLSLSVHAAPYRYYS